MSTCSIDGCHRPIKSRDWCNMHYLRWWNHGDPMINKRTEKIGDEVRFWRKVNKTDTCWLWFGYTNYKGYGVFRANGKTIIAHRYSWSLAHGSVPDLLDHICGVRACVNPDHLRPATPKQNAEHLVTQRPSRSGIRGVSWKANEHKWKVYAHSNGKQHLGGCYADIREAEIASIRLRLSLYTHSDEDRPRLAELLAQAGLTAAIIKGEQ